MSIGPWCANLPNQSDFLATCKGNIEMTKKTFPPLPTGSDIAYITFSSDIGPPSVDAIIKACTQMRDKGVKCIYILFSTTGGSTIHGIHLYNVLRGLDVRIITHNTGSVNSIGNVVFLAGQERYCVPNSSFLFHQVGIKMREGHCTTKDLLEKLDTITADQNNIIRIVQTRTRFSSREEVEKLFQHQVTKDSAYAKKRGIVHDIKPSRIPKGAIICNITQSGVKS